MATRSAVIAALPAPPDLEGFVTDLQSRIARADQRARGFWRPLDGLSELARLYHANGFFSQAAACELALIDLDPSNPLWPYLRAHILGGYGDLDQALPLLERTVTLDPGYLPARIRLGDTHLKQNRLSEARQAYQAVLNRGKDNGYAVLGLARTELAEGQPQSAQQKLQEFVARRPEFAPAWALLVSIDEQLGDERAAARHRAQAPAAGRQHEMPDPWIDVLMDACYDPYRLAVAASTADPANNQARARELLERAVTVAPEDDLSHRLLGNLLSDLGELAAARVYLERATELDPKEPDNWSYLVRLLKVMRDMPAANRALDAGLIHCPDAPVLHLEKGRRFAATGQYHAAAAAFERARRLMPEDSSASMELARVHFKQDRLEEGVEELRAVVRIDPAHPVAVVLLARYAISKGDESEAAFWIARARTQIRIPKDDLEQVTLEFRERFGRTP